MNTAKIAYALEHDPKTSKGSWFESYGKPPEFYGAAFTDFLEKHCDGWDVNDRKLQSDWSDVCGQYCIFFLSHKARGYSMNKYRVKRLKSVMVC